MYLTLLWNLCPPPPIPSTASVPVVHTIVHGSPRKAPPPHPCSSSTTGVILFSLLLLHHQGSCHWPELGQPGFSEQFWIHPDSEPPPLGDWTSLFSHSSSIFLKISNSNLYCNFIVFPFFLSSYFGSLIQHLPTLIFSHIHSLHTLRSMANIKLLPLHSNLRSMISYPPLVITRPLPSSSTTPIIPIPALFPTTSLSICDI